jgi:hypothetical protein
VQGPKRLLAIEVRPDTGGHWTPYAGQPSVGALFEEIASERELAFDRVKLDPTQGDFVGQISRVLEEATAENARPIVVLDPRCLDHAECQVAVTELLQRQWFIGLVIPVDENDLESAALVGKFRPQLQPSEDARDWVVVRRESRTIAEFRTAIVSVADEILARIVKNAEVRRPPTTPDGPDRRPRIANILDSARRA